MRSLSDGGGALEVQSRVARVVDLLLRHAERGAATPRLGWERPAVARVREYLHARLAENVSLDELTRVAGLTRFHLLRVFKQTMGLPPHEYQLVARVQAASRLLAKGERRAKVAAELGFADQSHFGRHFRRIAGVSPGAFAFSLAPSSP
jgi:AraC-like DNA-binding protein